MPWEIDHAIDKPDGTVVVCSVAFTETGPDGRRQRTRYQLQKAIRIPPPGPGHGPAVAAFRQMLKDLREQNAPPDRTALEAELNAGGE